MANGDTTVIEPTDIKKYKIAGERTGTFVTKVDVTELRHLGYRIFLLYIMRMDISWVLEPLLRHSMNPETQNIMDRIIHSFVFLK